MKTVHVHVPAGAAKANKAALNTWQESVSFDRPQSGLQPMPPHPSDDADESKQFTFADVVEVKAPVITPGGRAGDDAHLITSDRQNWVDKRGGLPQYIREIRNGLMKDGKSETEATQLAIAAVKRWARGGGKVSAKVRAAAAKAVAEWEAMKASK